MPGHTRPSGEGERSGIPARLRLGRQQGKPCCEYTWAARGHGGGTIPALGMGLRPKKRMVHGRLGARKQEEIAARSAPGRGRGYGAARERRGVMGEGAGAAHRGDGVGRGSARHRGPARTAGGAGRVARPRFVLAPRVPLRRRHPAPAAAAAPRGGRGAHPAPADRHRLVPAADSASGAARGRSGGAGPAVRGPRHPGRGARLPGGPLQRLRGAGEREAGSLRAGARSHDRGLGGRSGRLGGGSP